MSQADLQHFETVRQWLSSRCGIIFSENKTDLLRQRLARVLAEHNVRDMAALAQLLSDPNARDVQLAVLHAASVNHTYFFREPEVLERFITMALPSFADAPELRIWSAAASTGEEAYTIAMMLADHMGQAGLRRLMLLGTDISAPCIEKAELGVFDDRQLAHVPRRQQSSYFRATSPGKFTIDPTLRARCTFRRMNLKATPYPFSNPFQAVFCRNILYYFSQQDQDATVKAIHDVTAPGGWLVTSVTESIRHLGALWQPMAPGLYQKVGK